MRTIQILIIGLFFTFSISLNAQWAKTNGLPGGTTTTLIRFGDTLLANVGDGRYFYKNQELYFSTNHGIVWSPIINPAYTQIYPICTDGPSILGYAYNLTEQRYILYRTGDFFQTLTPIHFPNPMDLRDFFMAYGHIYATRYDTGFDLYRTGNDGVSWELVSTASPNDIQFDGERITGTDYTYVVQSSDQGFTWDTLLNYAGQQVISLLQHDNHLLAFIFEPEDGCYTSDNYGQTWQYYPNNSLSQFYRYVWHNEEVYGLDGDKMIRSSDYGQTWETVPLPPNSAYPAFQGVSSGNALIIGGIQSVGSSGMYRSLDNGSTWDTVSSGLVASSGKLRKVSDDLFVPSPSGLYKANADEVNWTIVDLAIPQPPNHYWIISDFVKTGNNWLLSDGQGIWVSEDQGNTWLKSWVQPGQANLPVDVLELENINNKVIAHGPWQGYDAYYYYISEDNGLTFHFIETLFEQKQTEIGLLEVSGDKVYVLGYDQKIYRSDDACATWVLQSDNLQMSGCGLPGWDVLSGSLQVSSSVIAVNADQFKKIHFSKDAGQNWTCYDLETTGSPWGNSIITDLLHVGNHLLAATQNGVYLSENDGTDWTDWNDGLLNNNITDIEAHNGFLWAASKGGGIWKRPLTELGMSATLDQGFFDTLLQFSPNPASQFVHIQISDVPGKLQIQDAMGRIVLQQSVDVPYIEISVEALPQGMYQVIFTSEKNTQFGSLVVQR